tara:strand:- start:220 stop:1911 length:1692 start_codon:yes stop_codon:yes gene_type:complete
MTLDHGNPPIEDQIRQWIKHDPDPVTRNQLIDLTNQQNQDLIKDLFTSRIRFGTAGLRGELGPGPNRMNQLTMRRLAIGLAKYLGEGKRVVLGRDGRYKSKDFLEDIACVLTANDIDVHIFPTVIPTPLLAFAVRHLETDMGVIVTASHNPSRDNGCKVYLSDGAQLRTPIDEEIDQLIVGAEFPEIQPLFGNGKRFEIDETVTEAYCSAIANSVTNQSPNIRIAYTPLHGVAMQLTERVFEQANAGELIPVQNQRNPDPDFPTVPFPNPEEQGVMDSVISLAQESKTDLAIAHDPDGDRLAVAIPTANGDWRSLSGDEIGALLFNHIVTKKSEPNRKVVTTVVCSELVSKIADFHGVEHESTLTGFKWIIPAAYKDPSLQPIFCYEEALGYATNPAVRDKDGISAALIMAELAAVAKRQGRSLEEELANLSLEFGHHVTKTKRIRFTSANPNEVIPKVMKEFREKSLSTINKMQVQSVKDYSMQDLESNFPTADLIVINLEKNVRISIRPSGTEPMIKLYMEKVMNITERHDLPRKNIEAKSVLEELSSWLENAFKELAVAK